MLKKILLVTKKAKNTMSAITELTNDGLLKQSDETYEEYDYWYCIRKIWNIKGMIYWQTKFHNL